MHSGEGLEYYSGPSASSMSSVKGDRNNTLSLTMRVEVRRDCLRSKEEIQKVAKEFASRAYTAMLEMAKDHT